MLRGGAIAAMTLKNRSPFPSEERHPRQKKNATIFFGVRFGKHRRQSASIAARGENCQTFIAAADVGEMARPALARTLCRHGEKFSTFNGQSSFGCRAIAGWLPQRLSTGGSMNRGYQLPTTGQFGRRLFKNASMPSRAAGSCKLQAIACAASW